MMKKPRKFLFVCYANQNRSPTAEEVLRELLKKRGYKVSSDIDAKKGRVVLSAGIKTDGEGRQITKELGDSVDEIFVMNRWMIDELADVYGQDTRKITTLDIPDVYNRNDPELIYLLRLKLTEYLDFVG